MDIKEYDENGNHVREIYQDGILVGKEEWPIQPEVSANLQPTLEDKINYLYYKDMGVI